MNTKRSVFVTNSVRALVQFHDPDLSKPKGFAPDGVRAKNAPKSERAIAEVGLAGLSRGLVIAERRAK